MNEAGQQRAIESLRDWSKWLIGLDFGAVVGCVFILENAATDGVVTPFLVIAIACFAVSVGCAVFLVHQLARVAEIIPIRDESGNTTTVFSHKVAANLSIGALATLQLVFLGIGSVFFVGWVIVKSIAGS